MKEELQLKLQAYLDGELPPGEAKSVTELIARDGDASALLTELTNTRNALAGFDDSIKLPESVEFHWSKIQREISRQPTPAPTPRLSLSASLRRFLVPAGAFAAVAIAALLTFPRTNGAGDAFTDATDGYGLRDAVTNQGSPGDFSLVSGAIFEVVATFIFVVVILGVTQRSAAPQFAGLAIGLTLVAIHIVGIQVTGVSVNPARSLGPAIWVGLPALMQLWLFVAAPMVGAGLAGWAFRVRLLTAAEA